MKVIYMLGPWDGKIMEVPESWLPTIRVAIPPVVTFVTAEEDLSIMGPNIDIATYKAERMNDEGILEVWYEG